MPLSSPNQKHIIVKQVCQMRTISKDSTRSTALHSGYRHHIQRILYVGFVPTTVVMAEESCFGIFDVIFLLFSTYLPQSPCEQWHVFPV